MPRSGWLGWELRSCGLRPDEKPADQKQRHARIERIRLGTHRPGHDNIYKQHPHGERLEEAPGVEHDRADSWAHIRWKFFSISRFVSRSITGRPWGHTVE